VRQQDKNRDKLDFLPGNLGFDNLKLNSGQSSIRDRSLSQMEDLMRMRGELAKLNESNLNSNQIFSNLNFLQQQISFYQKQFDNLISKNWILSKEEIQGISAYICSRCNTFNSRLIVDPVYDMTMQVKHRCGDNQVKGSQLVLPIQPNITNIDEWSAEILLNQLNSCIPDGKYLLTQDISNVFNFLASKLNYERMISLLGIPDRVYLYSLEKDYKLNWIDRALMNMGNKIVLEKFEIRDFLRRTSSTYAIFEIPKESTLKRVYMRITT
jgi:hypothetical protein